MEAEGTLAVRSEEDGTAFVELNDATVRMGEQQQKMPNFSFGGLKDDGTAPMSDGSQDAMIRMLLPVPSSALTPGESSTVEIQFPTRFNASVGYTPVLITMELNDIDRSEGHGVANFSVKVDSGKVVATSGGDFPEDFNMRINGSGTMRFNFEHGQHLGGVLTLNFENPSSHGQNPTKMSTEISLSPQPNK